MRRHLPWGASAVLLMAAALTGCAGTVVRPEEDSGSAARLAWETRLTALEALDDWTAAGRIALTVPEESVNANVEWRQSGDAFQLDEFLGVDFDERQRAAPLTQNDELVFEFYL